MSNDLERIFVAIHESGHVVVNALKGRVFRDVQISPEGEPAGGCTQFFPSDAPDEVACAAISASIGSMIDDSDELRRPFLILSKRKMRRTDELITLAVGMAPLDQLPKYRIHPVAPQYRTPTVCWGVLGTPKRGDPHSALRAGNGDPLRGVRNQVVQAQGRLLHRWFVGLHEKTY
jgi:hypothetical protein